MQGASTALGFALAVVAILAILGGGAVVFAIVGVLAGCALVCWLCGALIRLTWQEWRAEARASKQAAQPKPPPDFPLT